MTEKLRLITLCVLLSIYYSYGQRSITKKKQDSIPNNLLDEVTITATKVPRSKKNLGKMVYIISQRMINQSQGRSVMDLLNDVPGIEINGNYGTRGQNLGIYIRGGRNRQVAVLIDGAIVNDPSSFNGDFDLRLLSLDQVESIEVVKGAVSTLYGTGAATGVINILLKKPAQKKISGNFSGYTGTNASQEDRHLKLDEFNTSININGSYSKINYLLSIGKFSSKGLSAAESTIEDVSFEEDAFKRFNSLLKLGWQVNKRINLNLFANVDDFKTDYDGFDFMSNSYIDADNTLKNKQQRIGLQPVFSYLNGDLKLNTFYTNINRVSKPSDDHFEGQVFGFDLFNNYQFSNQVSLLTGLAFQSQDMSQNTAFSSIEQGSADQVFFDPYFTININSKRGYNFNIGARLNIHNEYGSHLVINLNPSYFLSLSKVSSIKFLASYSTAYITPTLQEIFNKSPIIGQLKPEKDATFEVGFDWQFSKSLNFNTVFFYREETDKISYDFITFQTLNDTGDFLARGFESELNLKMQGRFNFSLNYAYINRDKSLILKIPKHKAGISLNYMISDYSNLSLNSRFIDATTDFGDQHLPSYRLVDIFINQSFNQKKLTIFGAISNIFNEEYQELAGFSTRGRNYKIGLSYRF